MSKIFISYRRSDSPDTVDRIHARLLEQFGAENVFRDLESIPLGTEFTGSISAFLGEASVALVVIGPGWVDARSPDGTRRLDEPEDYVRREVETAFALGLTVIPLMVRNASIPRPEELPPTIRHLSQVNGRNIGTDPYFDFDVQQLIRGILSLAPFDGIPTGARLQVTDVLVHQEVDSLYATVDFRVSNLTDHDILITRISFVAVEVIEHFAFDYLDYAALYESLDLSAVSEAGQSAECPVSQRLRPGEVDRFGVKLAAPALEMGLYRKWVLHPILHTNVGQVVARPIEVWLPKRIYLGD